MHLALTIGVVQRLKGQVNRGFFVKFRIGSTFSSGLCRHLLETNLRKPDPMAGCIRALFKSNQHWVAVPLLFDRRILSHKITKSPK